MSIRVYGNQCSGDKEKNNKPTFLGLTYSLGPSAMFMLRHNSVKFIDTRQVDKARLFNELNRIRFENGIYVNMDGNPGMCEQFAGL